MKMGHWSPRINVSPLFSLSLVLDRSCQQNNRAMKVTYAWFDQSSPVGQRSAPVRSWLNPRSTLTFRAMGGVRACPFGVIQSRIAPLRLFVSSPLAPEAPFLSCALMSILFQSLTSTTDQFCDDDDFIIRGCYSILKPGDWVEEDLKYLIFTLFSVDYISKWSFLGEIMDILSSGRGKCGGLVHHTQYAIIEKSWEVAHSVHCPAEVSSMMNQWICKTSWQGQM